MLAFSKDLIPRDIMASMIDHLLKKVDEYRKNESYSFMILEAPSQPFFIQFAKIGEDFLLDIPISILYSQELDSKLLSLLKDKYRKIVIQNREEERLISYQFRFLQGEFSKLCYVAQDIFVNLFEMDKSKELNIAMR